MSVQCHLSPIQLRYHLQIHLVIVCYDRVIRSGWWLFGLQLISGFTILDKNLPTVIGHLQLVEIKRREVIHKVSFDLTTENVYFRPNDIQGMAVAAGRTWPGRQRPRPLPRGYNKPSVKPNFDKIAVEDTDLRAYRC
jgi:hypothetical protein